MAFVSSQAIGGVGLVVAVRVLQSMKSTLLVKHMMNAIVDLDHHVIVIMNFFVTPSPNESLYTKRKTSSITL